MPAPAEASSEVLREAYAPGTWDTSFANVWVNQKVAQSFLARTDFLLTHVELYAFDQPESNPPDILQVLIAEDAGNRPGAILGSTARQGQQSWSWVAFAYFPTVSLTAGRRYWIVAEDAEPRPKGYEWAMNAAGGYANGEAQWLDANAVDWTNATGADLFFRVFGISGPSILLDMEPGIWPADPGSTVPVELYFNNSGNEAAATLTLALVLDPGLAYAGDDAALQGGVRTGPLEWSFTGVGRGSHRLTVFATVDPSPDYFDGQSLEAWGFLNYTDASGARHAPSWDVATVTVLVPVIRGQAIPTPPHVSPGETFNFTVSFFNVGSGVASYLWANASARARLTILGDDAAGAGGVPTGAFSWLFRNVSAQAYVFNVTVRADPSGWPGDRLSLQVNLTYTDGAGHPFEQTAILGSASIHGPSVIVEATGSPSQARPGDVLTLALYANNTGDETASRVWLNVTTPGRTDFVDSQPVPSFRQAGRLEYAFPNLAPGPVAVILRIRVADGAPPATPLDTVATLGVARGSTLLRPSAASVAATVVTPRFVLSLAAAPARVGPGDTIDLSVAWNNSGNEQALRVWMNLTIPAKTLLVNSSIPWSTTNGTVYGWVFRDVAPGSGTLAVRLEVSARLEGQETLVARATLAFERPDRSVLAVSSTSASVDGIGSAPPPGGLEVMSFWIAVLVAAFLLFLLLGYWDVLPRRRGTIDDVFLLHNSGILICHYSTTLRPDVDADIASGMLMAVRNFVADALRTKTGALQEMRYGDHRIHMVHGTHAILVVFMRGSNGRNLETRMAEVLRNIEMAYANVLETWSGRTDEFRGIEEYLLRLVNA